MCVSSFFSFSLNWIGPRAEQDNGGGEERGVGAWAGACRVNSINFLAASAPLAPPLLPLLVIQMKIYCICFMHALTQYKQEMVVGGCGEGTVGQTDDNRDI